MQIKNGRIKYAAGKVFQSDWGERQNIVVEMDDGSTEKLYFEKGRQPHASLKRGQQATPPVIAAFWLGFRLVLLAKPPIPPGALIQ